MYQLIPSREDLAVYHARIARYLEMQEEAEERGEAWNISLDEFMDVLIKDDLKKCEGAQSLGYRFIYED